MASKIKQKKFSRTATETNADILERIGGSGGAAYRSSRSKRPDIITFTEIAPSVPVALFHLGCFTVAIVTFTFDKVLYNQF